MDLVTLADAPTLAPDAELPRAQIVVAKLGQFKDRRYGEFGITRGHVDDWQRNLGNLAGGQAPIDFDHGPEKGQGSKAAAWITALSVKTGAQLKAEDPRRFARLADDREYAAADVEFSRAGADAVRNKEYRLISPTFTDHYRDETGTDHGRALIGAALTNRPALKRDMPVISLSDDVAVDGAAEDVTTLGWREALHPRDARGRFISKIEKLPLGTELPLHDIGARVTKDIEGPSGPRFRVHLAVPSDAERADSRFEYQPHGVGAALGRGLTAAEVADVVNRRRRQQGMKTLDTRPSDSRPAMTPLANIAKALRLDEDATEATILSHIGDVVILDATAHADLERRAQAGDTATRALAEQRFTTAWDKALAKHAVAPAEKDDLKALYDVQPDTVIRLLDARAETGAAVVPGTPRGDGTSTRTLTDSPDPQDRQAILDRARQLMAADKTLTLSDALDRVEDEIAATRQEA